jgi:catechol 2,3-dioxygenase-like lactoylglutathione lyase family enzyme
VSADTKGMPARLHHIVVDTYDLPRLARFWAQALGWRILSGREREIVIGSGRGGGTPGTDGAHDACPPAPMTPQHTVTNR